MIVSNPPYVARNEEAQLPREVREHEPHEALFCGATGTEIYAPLISQAAELLRSGGLLALEIGYGRARARPLAARRILRMARNSRRKRFGGYSSDNFRRTRIAVPLRV